MRFQTCGIRPLGLYPTVTDVNTLVELFESGVTAVQLKVNHLKGEELEEAIKKASEIAKEYNARLFVSDFWELAIKYNAYGVHMSEKHLNKKTLRAIHLANLRLGISSNKSLAELKKLNFQPSYVMVDYANEDKELNILEGQKHLLDTLQYPLVLAGNMTFNRVEELLKKVSIQGITLISSALEEKGAISKRKTKSLVNNFRNIWSKNHTVTY